MTVAPSARPSVLSAITAGPTIAQRMAATGRASGFDYLRLALAVLVVASHALQTSSGAIPDFLISGNGQFLHNIIVPMFFGLGGFLVAGSLDRTRSLVTYLGLRVIRIFPALWADILLSALVLGPLVTTLPLQEYFSASEFKLYFLNLVGDIHYLLPGVFKNNPEPLVNGQLWTVPWDLGSYVALSVFVLLGLYRRKQNIMLLAIAAQVAFPLLYAGAIIFFNHHFVPLRVTVVPAFITGVAFHVYRDRIVWNGTLGALSLAVIIVTQLIDPRLILFQIFPMLYLTVYLGLLNPARTWIISSGDYSYGIFLYHRQLQQALWLLVPFCRTWYGVFIVSLPASFALAYLSWHLIEKYALQQKTILNRLDDTFLRLFPFTSIGSPNYRPPSPPKEIAA
jgi:peptidoglycan/LPS O-acetylase OafA/YrhL